jgi:adrenodoxin-NADP+ reductase
MNLSSAGFQPLDSNLLPTANWISALPRLEQRKYRFSSLLARGSTTPYNTASRTWALQSLLSPANFVPSKSRPDHVRIVTCALNQFSEYDNRFEANAKTVVTAGNVQLDASLVFRSIGYKSTAIKGLTEELGIPFDERTGTIPNDMYGRIITASHASGSPATTHLPGLYCAGWVKRGPTGVIASTMDDAFASADTILKDWVDKVEFLNGSPATKQSSDSRGWDGVIQHAEVKAANVRQVSWQDWKMIDAEERRRGQLKGKPREKFVTTQDMLKVLD